MLLGKLPSVFWALVSVSSFVKSEKYNLRRLWGGYNKTIYVNTERNNCNMASYPFMSVGFDFSCPFLKDTQVPNVKMLKSLTENEVAL